MANIKNKYLIQNTLNFVDKGWINAIDINSGYKVLLCENTRLELVCILKSTFKVVSGVYKGKLVVIPNNWFNLPAYKINFKKRFKANLSVSKDFLYFKGFKFKLTESVQIPKGDYYIGYPDRPRFNVSLNYKKHPNGGNFISTWFPILNKDKKVLTYLHIGTFSKGCITLDILAKDKSGQKWNVLYMYLINSSLDSLFIGELTII